MSRIPLHMLTGFLGSGKTTLLNRLLREPALSDSAVLINEVGAVSIDHHLVERMEQGEQIDITVLRGGCTCCALRGDLVAALRELYQRRADGSVPPFRRVVLETTGLADPAPILFTLSGDLVLRHKFEAGVTIATVDAVHATSQSLRHPEWRKQVAVADRIVITKADLVEPEPAAQLVARLRHLNPAAEILDAQTTAPARLFDTSEAASALPAARSNAHGLGTHAGHDGHERRPVADHSFGIESIAIMLDDAVEWSAFAVWLTLLLHAHGEKILRFKALLDVAAWSGPVVLNGVHHLIHPPIHLREWPAKRRQSCLVFIVQDLQADLIERSLRAFLAETSSHVVPAPMAVG